MALSVEIASAGVLRHVVAQTRRRRPLFGDSAARVRAARQLADSCCRHHLRCLVWCVTDRCLHVVLRGAPGAITLATHELLDARLRHGQWQSSAVQHDLYLLEVARHALLAPVRARLCRLPTDWPFSSARESCGLRPMPPWLDPSPLFRLLGAGGEAGPARLRRFLDATG